MCPPIHQRSSLKPEDHFLRLTLEGEGEEFGEWLLLCVVCVE